VQRMCEANRALPRVQGDIRLLVAHKVISTFVLNLVAIVLDSNKEKEKDEG
jgi:hypothetical protein